MQEEIDYEWVLIENQEDDTCYLEKRLTPEGFLKLLKEDHALHGLHLGLTS